MDYILYKSFWKMKKCYVYVYMYTYIYIYGFLLWKFLLKTKSIL